MKFKYIFTVIAASLISDVLYAESDEGDLPTTAVETISIILIEKGYEAEMINDLFGDEYFYFPKSDSELDLSFYIVDKIIENGQYTINDKDELKSLAADAYVLYQDLIKGKNATNLE